MAQTIRCTIVTPQQQVLDEQVTYASIPSWNGQIGVEHMRAPLFVELGEGVLSYDDAKGQVHTILLSGGFAQMKNDELSILTEAAFTPEQIDRTATEKELASAQEISAATPEEQARKQKLVTRAQNKLQLISKTR